MIETVTIPTKTNRGHHTVAVTRLVNFLEDHRHLSLGGLFTNYVDHSDTPKSDGVSFFVVTMVIGDNI